MGLREAFSCYSKVRYTPDEHAMVKFSSILDAPAKKPHHLNLLTFYLCGGCGYIHIGHQKLEPVKKSWAYSDRRIRKPRWAATFRRAVHDYDGETCPI